MGIMLLSLHNVTELIRFTQQIREAILRDTFTTEFAHWLDDAELVDAAKSQET
ncbi:MAG TPA: hypothetical protein V6C95_13340 [Coleofasciculaceae cyanobacterium]